MNFYHLFVGRVKPKCPVDNKDIKKESTFPDSAISREIGGLKCRCNNSIIGCQWVGEVRTVAVSHSSYYVTIFNHSKKSNYKILRFVQCRNVSQVSVILSSDWFS